MEQRMLNSKNDLETLIMEVTRRPKEAVRVTNPAEGRIDIEVELDRWWQLAPVFLYDRTCMRLRAAILAAIEGRAPLGIVFGAFVH